MATLYTKESIRIIYKIGETSWQTFNRKKPKEGENILQFVSIQFSLPILDIKSKWRMLQNIYKTLNAVLLPPIVVLK